MASQGKHAACWHAGTSMAQQFSAQTLPPALHEQKRNKDSPSVCRAKDLISKLLTIQPSTRLTASQALQHQWLTGDLGAVPNLSKTRQNMRRHLRSKFRVSLGPCTPQLWLPD